MNIQALVTAGLCLLALPAGAGEKTTAPEERDKVVRLTRELEETPMGTAAEEKRRWLVAWLIEAPDVTVRVCSDLTAPLNDSNSRIATWLASQVLFSSAAYVIENPDRAEDDVEVWYAGVQGMLRAYDAVGKYDGPVKLTVTSPFMARLARHRHEGTLRQWVLETSAPCRE